ncbi:MAG TPA: hemerythrin domain-containing protein [Stellaceae bacterium]|nr:hemerythrin domain-containing protein [Stellaceae bacterium]
MPTNAKTKQKRSEERKTRSSHAIGGSRNFHPSNINALDLLEHDHREVEELFDEFDETEKAEEKDELARKICMELTVHAQIEEEIFYPEARRATQDNELIDEAMVEHASAKHLIAEIEEMEAGDELFDAKVKVLGEQMKRHIMEEEEELFPELANAKMNLDAIGERMAKRKAELLKEMQEA